jgi:plastocyanin
MSTHMGCRRRLFALIATILFPIAGWAATTNVDVGPGLAFNPSSVTIAPGDTVQWNWIGEFHSSTSNATSGPEFWDSGVQSTGTFSHTFSTVGDWPYYCLLHSSPTGTSMNGVVHVVAAATTLTSVNPTSGPPAGGTVVTLTGTNFASGCTASFGTTTAASTTVSDSTTILATTPAHAAGVVDVSVACPGGSATLSAAFTFAPAVAPVAPVGGPALSGRGLLILAAALAMAGALALRIRGM